MLRSQPKPAAVAWLPLQLVWPGFVLDAVLYAAAWWLVLLAPLCAIGFARILAQLTRAGPRPRRTGQTLRFSLRGVLTRRRLIRLSMLAVLCLLLGAATTAVVLALVVRKMGAVEIDRAWLDKATRVQLSGKVVWAAGWPAVAQGEWASEPRDIKVERGRACAVVEAWAPDCAMKVVQYGWPAPALARLVWTAPVSGPDIHVRDGPQPLQPLWQGLVQDAAVFVGLWAVLLGVPLPLYRLVRSRVRMSRGVCPCCAYDLRSLAAEVPCPECGEGATP
jgi:hypothetical protein